MSQDYFLSKVYESVRNQTAAPSNKPQNLKQAYYRVVLEQINEDTDLLMQDRDAEGKPVGDVEEFRVSDTVASKIRSQIGSGGTDFKDVLDSLLGKAGIKEKKTSNAYANASRSVRWFLTESDFTYSKQLFESCIKNNGFVKLLQASQYNLLDTAVNAAKQKLQSDFNITIKDEGSLKSFFTSLIKDKPDIGNRLGEGEFFCSLFTDAKLSGSEGGKKSGDLEVGGVKIELKATKSSGGRLSGDGTANKAMVSIPNLLKDKFKYSDVGGEIALRNLKEFESFVDKESQTQNKKEGFQNIKQWLLDKLKTPKRQPGLNIFGKFFTSEEAVDSLEVPVNSLLIKTLRGSGIPFIERLKQKIKSEIVNTQEEVKKGPSLKGGFQRKLDDLLYSTFNSIKEDTTISMDDIVSLISLTNNYEDSKIKEELKRVLPKTPESFFEKYANNIQNINKLVGAMYVYSYSRVMVFDKLMAINTNSFNVIIFDKPENLEEALTIVNNPSIEIDCSIDAPSAEKIARGETKGGTEIGKSVYFTFRG